MKFDAKLAIATAMVLGDDVPVACDWCNGTGVQSKILGFDKCSSCRGAGILGVSLRTWVAMGHSEASFWNLYIGKNQK